MATAPKKLEPTPSMQDIMDIPLEDIKAPAQLPVGTYTAMVVGPPNEGVASTGTRYYQFVLSPQEAWKDVDKDALAEALIKLDGTVMRLQDKTILSQRYYVSDAAMIILKNFIADLGIPFRHTDGSKKNPMEALMEAPGKLVVITVTHGTSSRGGIYANVASTSPIE